MAYTKLFPNNFFLLDMNGNLYKIDKNTGAGSLIVVGNEFYDAYLYLIVDNVSGNLIFQLLVSSNTVQNTIVTVNMKTQNISTAVVNDPNYRLQALAFIR